MVRLRTELGLAAITSLVSAGQLDAAMLGASTADARTSAQVAGGATADGGNQAAGTVGSATYAAGGPNGSGSGGESWYDAIVIPFQLPDLGNVANPFETADFRIVGTGGENGFAYFGLDLYGLGRRGSSEVLGGDFYLGGSDPTDATLIQNDFRYIANDGGAAGAAYNTNAAGDTALVAYLNALYDGGAGTGQYAFLRLNVDNTNVFFKYFNFHSADAADAANRPSITYTLIPEPASLALLALGLIAVPCRGRAEN